VQALKYLNINNTSIITRYLSRPARAAGYQCVFPPPSALPCSSSNTELTANVQTVAGIISLLNDYLLSKGSAPLGFLNPWLYGEGLPGIDDITSGSNPGCGTDGFSAIPGWDPVRPARLVSLHVRCWLIFGSVGDGSRDARLCGPAVHAISQAYGYKRVNISRKDSTTACDSRVPFTAEIVVVSNLFNPCEGMYERVCLCLFLVSTKMVRKLEEDARESET
jgi:hypothetical protein